METLTLMADYECWPLWTDDNIDPEDLPVSQLLKEDLSAWSSEYDATLDQDYPPQSGFVDEQTAAVWLATGEELSQRLRMELPGSQWTVEYFHAHHSPAEYVWRKI